MKILDLRTHSKSYVTTSGLAEYWQVSRKQIYKQIDAGTLAAIRLGPRSLRIGTAEAIRFEEIAKMSPPAERDTASRRLNYEGVMTAVPGDVAVRRCCNKIELAERQASQLELDAIACAPRTSDPRRWQ